VALKKTKDTDTMIFNQSVQNVSTRSWDGSAAYAKDLSHFNNFSWSMEVTADIVTDAVFNFESAPASAADRCVPGTFTDVLEIARCTKPAAGAKVGVTIPAGTKAGTICAASLPCKPDQFVKPKAISGDTANVVMTLLRSGPSGGILRKVNIYA
jgi:hypothetical protein